MAQTSPRFINSATTAVESRSENRASTIYRPVLFETEDFAGFCLVRNISPQGLMGEVYTILATDTSVSVKFESHTIVNGHVKWCRDGKIGIEFDKPVDVTKILSSVAAKTFDGKVNRAPRLQIRSRGEVIFERRPIPIELQNISQKGLRIQAAFLQPGEEVQVRLDGMPGRNAIVRWTQHGSSGLNFISPIPFSELAEWVIATNFPSSNKVK